MGDIEKVNKVIMKMSFLDSIPDRDKLLKIDLGIDSLRLVELVIELENELGIISNIADLDPKRLNTVGDIYLLCGVE